MIVESTPGDIINILGDNKIIIATVTIQKDALIIWTDRNEPPIHYATANKHICCITLRGKDRKPVPIVEDNGFKVGYDTPTIEEIDKQLAKSHELDEVEETIKEAVNEFNDKEDNKIDPIKDLRMLEPPK